MVAVSLATSDRPMMRRQELHIGWINVSKAGIMVNYQSRTSTISVKYKVVSTDISGSALNGWLTMTRCHIFGEGIGRAARSAALPHRTIGSLVILSVAKDQ